MGLTHQIYQIQRAMEQYGQECIFRRTGTNEYREPTEPVEILKCKGLFHSSNGFLNISLVDSGQLDTQKQPKLLISNGDIRKNDFVTVNNRDYTITGTDDLGNLHLWMDLSLREEG